MTQAIGRGLLWLAPWLMKALSVLGTLAMFLVGGGILAHGWHDVGHTLETFSAATGALAPVSNMLLTLVVGLVAGALALAGVTLVHRIRASFS